MDSEIAAFVKERNEVLLTGDVDRVLAFHAKHNLNVRFSSRKVAEIAMHKARTACVGLPMEARLESRRWLRDRNYGSLDDGNLTDA